MSPDVMRSRIQARLNEIGVSASDASVKAGMNRAFLHKVLSDTSYTPRPASIRKVAAALVCKPEYLTGESDDASPPPAGPKLEIQPVDPAAYVALSSEGDWQVFDYICDVVFKRSVYPKVAEIASACDVSHSTAQARLQKIMAAKLTVPGKATNYALSALGINVAERRRVSRAFDAASSSQPDPVAAE